MFELFTWPKNSHKKYMHNYSAKNGAIDCAAAFSGSDTLPHQNQNARLLRKRALGYQRAFKAAS